MSDLPSPVRAVLSALWSAGYAAYPVGGCVRDRLLGREPKDWDVCTDATPAQTARVFASFRVIETGLRHGTLTVLSQGEPIEITTFRVESGYADRRHPDRVTFVTELRADLARRDFTMNAMAFDRDGSVIDPFGGRDDLCAGVVRCVGDPAARFEEDALRILRALRFAARYEFRVEENTAAAIRASCALLAFVSRERIFSELCGLLTGPGAGAQLRAFPEVIFTVIPELRAEAGFDQRNPNHIHDIWTHSAMAVDAAPPARVPRLTMLLHDIGKPACFTVDAAGVGHFYRHAQVGARMADEILRRLRCDNDTRREVVRLIELHDTVPPQTKKGVRRLLTKLGEPTLRALFWCWRADSADRAPAVRARNGAEQAETARLLEEILAGESCFSLRDLAVRGDDLLDAGFVPGPAVGRALAELLRLVQEEGVPNERDILLEHAQNMNPQKDKISR